jgi:hypothetical protein
MGRAWRTTANSATAYVSTKRVGGCVPALDLPERRDADSATDSRTERIVVGYDGSAAARRALERAARLSGGKADVAVVAAARLSVSGVSVLPDPRLERERDELLREANALLRGGGSRPSGLHAAETRPKRSSRPHERSMPT